MSDWAPETMASWEVDTGGLSGKSDTLLNPQDRYIRAKAAQNLSNLIQAFQTACVHMNFKIPRVRVESAVHLFWRTVHSVVKKLPSSLPVPSPTELGSFSRFDLSF